MFQSPDIAILKMSTGGRKKLENRQKFVFSETDVLLGRFLFS